MFGLEDGLARQGEHYSLNFMNQLQAAFSQQFGQNQQILNLLHSKLQAVINNPQGFSPEKLAALRTSAIQQTAAGNQAAVQATNQAIAARGGSTLPSGVNAQIQGQMAQSAENQESGMLNQINIANEDQRQQNYWNAVSGLGGVASQINPLGYAGASSTAGNTLANLSQAYTASQAMSMGPINSIAGGLGQGIGGGLTAGFASGGALFCWVAAACFNEGFDGLKTTAVRNWLLTEWAKNWYARPVLALYRRYGLWISKQPALVRLLTPLFEAAYREATA